MLTVGPGVPPPTPRSLGWDGRAEGRGFTVLSGHHAGTVLSSIWRHELHRAVSVLVRLQRAVQVSYSEKRHFSTGEPCLSFLEAASVSNGERVRIALKNSKGWFKNNPGQDSGSHVAALEIAPLNCSESRVLPSCSEMKTRRTHWAKWIYGWSFHLGILLSFVPLRTPCL